MLLSLQNNANFLMNGEDFSVNEDIVRYVSAASAGDTDAMAKLFSKTLKSSYYLAYRLSGDHDEAVEITKNAYTRVFCTLPRLKKPEAFEIFMRQNIASVYKEGRKFTFGDALADIPEGQLEFLSEDVYEEDLTPHGNGWFKYELKNNKLKEIHMMDNGGAEIPQIYIVTLLTDKRLEYYKEGYKSEKYYFNKQ